MMLYEPLYPYYPFRIKTAKGVWIEASNGKKYLDTFSGIGVSLLGHQHPAIHQAICNKMRSGLHFSNFFQDIDLEECILRLNDLSGLSGKVLFTNSGAEANEWALKMILKTLQGQQRFLLHFEKSFHGRTTGALSLNGNPSQRSPFEPLLDHTVMLPWNDVESLDRWMAQNSHHVGAIFLEFIQGSGGVRVLSEAMVSRIHYWRSRSHFLIVADEVQTGLGRTGNVFAFQRYGIIPDILTLGKGLGGGLPLGAVVVNQSMSPTVQPGDHGSTMAPNPLALAACKVVLSLVPSLTEKVRQNQIKVHNMLESQLERSVKEIRGTGYMIGIDVGVPLPDLVKKAYEEYQLLINVVQGQVIRLLPPLNISMKDWQRIVITLRKLLGGVS